MAVVIRLSRHGKKDHPFYRVVAADKRYPRDGRYLEILGTFNPKTKEVKLNKDKVQGWIAKGALATATVRQLISRAG